MDNSLALLMWLSLFLSRRFTVDSRAATRSSFSVAVKVYFSSRLIPCDIAPLSILCDLLSTAIVWYLHIMENHPTRKITRKLFVCLLSLWLWACVVSFRALRWRTFTLFDRSCYSKLRREIPWLQLFPREDNAVNMHSNHKHVVIHRLFPRLPGTRNSYHN